MQWGNGGDMDIAVRNTAVILAAIVTTAIGACGAGIEQGQQEEYYQPEVYQIEDPEAAPAPDIDFISTTQQDIRQSKKTYSVAQEIKDEDAEAELDMIAQMVAAEAENQSLYGKRLVVDVILNRVDSDEYPDTITGVLNQPGAFSSMENGRYDRAAWEVSDEDYTAVAMELQNRMDPDILFFTAGAYGKYGTPVYQVGDHYFCRR